MKIKKSTMRVINILLILMLMLSFATNVFAMNNIPKPGSSPAADRVGKLGSTVLGVVQVVGMTVAVIMLIVVAIKYMSAAPDAKAEIKKSSIQYVVGAFLLFGASGILEIVKQASIAVTANN